MQHLHRVKVSANPPRRRRRIGWALGLGALALAALVAAGVWALCHRASRELDERLLRIRRDVAAFDEQASAPRPVLLGEPAAGNAADDYEALNWAWGAEGELPADLPPEVLAEREALGSQPLSDEESEALGVFLEDGGPLSAAGVRVLARRLPLLHHLRAGLRRTRCDWGHDFALGSMAPFPDCLREVATMLAAHGLHTDDPQRALDAGLELLAFAQDFDRHPALIMGLLASRIERRGVQVLARALERFPLDAQQLERVEAVLDTLAEPDLRPHLEATRIEVEVDFLATTGRYLRPGLECEDLGLIREDEGPLSEVFMWRELQGVDHFHRLHVEGTALPFPQRVGIETRFEEELDSTTFMMAKIATLNCFPAEIGLDEQRALRGCLRGLLAAHRHRLEHGRFPEALELAADPFRTGAPLRYRLEGGRVQVYSIGENQVDDGGAGGDVSPGSNP